METALSLGSNLGDRLANLRAAATRLMALPGFRLLAQAPLYETEPVGVKPAYAHLLYLNTVMVMDVPPDPDALSRAVHGIEDELGRVRTGDPNAPRTIDIDILYAGRETRSDGVLNLPHPRWSQRRFVVQPLADVRPDLVIPGMERPVRDVLAMLPPDQAVRRVMDTWLP